MRIEHVQPAEDGALIVRRSAPNELTRFRVDDELERLGVPSIALVGLFAHTQLVSQSVNRPIEGGGGH